jgi:hypothetical protein
VRLTAAFDCQAREATRPGTPVIWSHLRKTFRWCPQRGSPCETPPGALIGDRLARHSERCMLEDRSASGGPAGRHQSPPAAHHPREQTDLRASWWRCDESRSAAGSIGA